MHFSFRNHLLTCLLIGILIGIGASAQESKPKTVPAEAAVQEIEATEVKKKLDRGDAFILIDVREQHEWDAGHIEAARHIPLKELKDQLNQLDKNSEVIVYCKSGKRSQTGGKILKEAGFPNVQSMKGGITAWVEKVDPSMPKPE